MVAAQTAEFKRAVEDSRTLTQKPTDAELLEVRLMFEEAAPAQISLKRLLPSRFTLCSSRALRTPSSTMLPSPACST